MPIKTLVEFGLTEKEARVYLAMLELEVAGVNEIAKKAGINRSSAYVVIESLKKKGFVNISPDKKVQHLIATSPELLLQLVKDRVQKFSSIQTKIEEILPELKALHKETRRKPKVVVYEGEEANRISRHETFGGSEFRIFKDLDDMPNTVDDGYFEQDAKKRREQGVKMYLIAPNTKGNQAVIQEYKKHGAPDEFALIPKEKFSRSAAGKNIGIGIFKDRIKFSSAREKFAIFIIDEAIAETLRDLFDLAWSEVKQNERDELKRSKK